VVIDNLDVVGVTISPLTADALAVIDPNAVLSCSIPCQLFETIGRGDLQIGEGMCVVEHAQFPQRDLLDVRRQPSGAPAGEDLLGLTFLEWFDHGEIV
jgi:hypothetical protein